MDLLPILEKLANAGGMFLLALVTIYWGRVDAEKKIAQEREDKILMITALKDNTAILSELKTMIGRMNHGKG